MSGGDGIGKIHRGLKKTLYVGGEGGGQSSRTPRVNVDALRLEDMAQIRHTRLNRRLRVWKR